MMHETIVSSLMDHVRGVGDRLAHLIGGRVEVYRLVEKPRVIVIKARIPDAPQLDLEVEIVNLGSTGPSKRIVAEAGGLILWAVEAERTARQWSSCDP